MRRLIVPRSLSARKLIRAARPRQQGRVQPKIARSPIAAMGSIGPFILKGLPGPRHIMPWYVSCLFYLAGARDGFPCHDVTSRHASRSGNHSPRPAAAHYSNYFGECRQWTGDQPSPGRGLTPWHTYHKCHHIKYVEHLAHKHNGVSRNAVECRVLQEVLIRLLNICPFILEFCFLLYIYFYSMYKWFMFL